MSTATCMPEPPPAPSTSSRVSALADPGLRRDLLRFAKKRVGEHEADDIVQATLADALAAERGPEDAEEVRRWVHRIARNKIVDGYRRGKREVPSDLADCEAGPESVPYSARELLYWAERELPQGESRATLDLMLREGDGERLEQLAREASLPAPRLRQRVSRLRRYFRDRWAAQLAAAALVGGIGLVAWMLLRQATPDEAPIVREPVLRPEPRAQELRRLALERCAVEDWSGCERGLDDAKRLDPAGEQDPQVAAARAALAARTATPKGQLPAPTMTDEPKPRPTPAPRAPMLKKNAPDESLPQKGKLSLPEKGGLPPPPVQQQQENRLDTK